MDTNNIKITLKYWAQKYEYASLDKYLQLDHNFKYLMAQFKYVLKTGVEEKVLKWQMSLGLQTNDTLPFLGKRVLLNKNMRGTIQDEKSTGWENFLTEEGVLKTDQHMIEYFNGFYRNVDIKLQTVKQKFFLETRWGVDWNHLIGDKKKPHEKYNKYWQVDELPTTEIPMPKYGEPNGLTFLININDEIVWPEILTWDYWLDLLFIVIMNLNQEFIIYNNVSINYYEVLYPILGICCWVIGAFYGLYLGFYFCYKLYQLILWVFWQLITRILLRNKLVEIFTLVMVRMIKYGRNYAKLYYYTNKEYLYNLLPLGKKNIYKAKRATIKEKKIEEEIKEEKIDFERELKKRMIQFEVTPIKIETNRTIFKDILKPKYYYGVFKAAKTSDANLQEELNIAEYYNDWKKIKPIEGIPKGLHLNWFYYDYYAYKNRNNYKWAFRYDYATPVISSISSIVNRRMAPIDKKWNKDWERSRLNFFDLPSGVLKESKDKTSWYSMFTVGKVVVNAGENIQVRLALDEFINFWCWYIWFYINSVGGNGWELPLFTCFFLALIISWKHFEYKVKKKVEWEKKRARRLWEKERKELTATEDKKIDLNKKQELIEPKKEVSTIIIDLGDPKKERNIKKKLIRRANHIYLKIFYWWVKGEVQRKKKVIEEIDLVILKIKAFIVSLLTIGLVKETIEEYKVQKEREEKWKLLGKIILGDDLNSKESAKKFANFIFFFSFWSTFICVFYLKITDSYFSITLREKIENQQAFLQSYILKIWENIMEYMGPLNFIIKTFKNYSLNWYKDNIMCIFKLDFDLINSIKDFLIYFKRVYLDMSITYIIKSIHSIISLTKTTKELYYIIKVTLWDWFSKPARERTFYYPKYPRKIEYERGFSDWFIPEVYNYWISSKGFARIMEFLAAIFENVVPFSFFIRDLIMCFPVRGFVIVSLGGIIILWVTIIKISKKYENLIEEDVYLSRNREFIKRWIIKDKIKYNTQFKTKGIWKDLIASFYTKEEKRLYLLYKKYWDKIKILIMENRKW